MLLLYLMTQQCSSVPNYETRPVHSVHNSAYELLAVSPSQANMELVCKMGEYADTITNKCEQCPAGRYGSSYDLTDSLCTTACPKGYYCTKGTAKPSQKCPPGRYGSVLGMSDAQCTGPCSAGYFCPAGSVDAQERQCGNVTMYCPLESGARLRVGLGYYTVGGDRRTRTGQRAW